MAKLKKKMQQALIDAANANTQISKDMLGIGHETLDFSRQQYADSQAELDRIRPTLDALASGQITATTLSNDITKQSWDDYNTTYRPIEQRVAADAMAAGTPGEQELAAGKAGIDVQRGIDIQRGAADRSMASMGVNPNSGKFASGNRTAMILGAAARAGAETGARERERLRGDVLRSSVADRGRGVTGTALAGVSVGGNAANTAAGLTGAGSNASNALGQQYLGNLAGASGLHGNAANVNSSAADIYQNVFNNRMAISAQNSGGAAALGQGLGTIAGMGMMFSDENMKTVKRAARGARKAIDGMRVEKWKYKPGTPASDGGADHVGTYAQDFQKQTGLGDGRTINVIDAIGVNMAATKELSKDLRSLRKQIQARGVAA